MLIGNAIVGQSGGPTAAINATLAGVIRGAANARGTIKTLYGMQNGVEGLLSEHLILLDRYYGREDELFLLAQTPAAALGSCRKKLPVPDADPAFYESLLAVFKKYDIRYFFYIGGNDSMDTVAKLSAYLKTVDYEMRVVGIPKTIDNDLEGTDHTPGFGSAAKYVATTIGEFLSDCAVYTVPAVTIVEIMGRDAGWLTAAAALPRAVGGVCPDLIYLPERVFDTSRFLHDVRLALAKHPNVVIAVSEGIRYADGGYVGAGTQSGARDVFGHSYLAGTGKMLEALVRAELQCKVRSVELSISQRCASHLASLTDLRESGEVGAQGVAAAVAGESGCMMSIQRTGDDPYRVAYTSADVSEIANRIRTVPDEFITPEGNQITDACVSYLLPLIQGEPDLRFRLGMPEKFRFDS